MGWLEEYIKQQIKMDHSDDVIKRDVIREVIYRQSAWLSLAKDAVPVMSFDGIDVKWSFPTEMTGEYPVPEDATTTIEKPMQAVEFSMTLQQGEVRYYMTDYAKLRQLGNFQVEFSRRRAAEKLAELKNKNILDALFAGAYSSNDTAATAAWDTFPTTATGTGISRDIAAAMGKILANSEVQMEEMNNFVLLVPSSVWAVTQAPVEIENIRQSIASYFGSRYSLKIYPLRYSTLTTAKAAYLYVNSPNTIIHGVLNPGAGGVPLVEETRKEGRGTEYLIRQFFNTKVVPYSSTVATSARVAKITGVLT